MTPTLQEWAQQLIALPERLLTLLYPRGLYETYLQRRYPTPDPTNSADMPSTAATD